MNFLSKGNFSVGCNYWASNAGIYMWQNFDEEVIRKDIKLLSDNGITVLRVFPLWSDFQPIRTHFDMGVKIKDIRLGEQPLDKSPEGVAGVDPIMIERFERLLDIGEEFGISFVVGLITGWMSGRLYMPEALAGREPITDPIAIKWQLKFVKYMVARFKSRKIISAWELGNECNCMSEVQSSEQAYNWVSLITDAVKSLDNSRPVISGMHSLDIGGNWRIGDQAEILDVLTTHPYSIFVPHCDTDPYNEMKTILHSTAETVFYRSVGGKPAFIEEIGGLGTWIASEEVQAKFFKNCLYSAWAHDLMSAMWWCAFDQHNIKQTPYDWSGIERYLGMFRNDLSPKPVVKEIRDFLDVVKSAGPLSDRTVDAVCVIGHTKDSWKTAYGSFILAKKAGIDIEFADIDGDLPESKAYMLPSLTGSLSVYKHQLDNILEKVNRGAALYISANDLIFCDPLENLVGIKVENRAMLTSPAKVVVDGEELSISARYRTVFSELDGEVLLRDSKDNAVLAKRAYGKGIIYYLAYPIEDIYATEPSVCTGENEQRFEKMYALIKELRNSEKRFVSDNPYVGVTEHPESDGKTKVVLVNYRPTEQTVTLESKSKPIITYGDVKELEDGRFLVAPNSGAVLVY